MTYHREHPERADAKGAIDLDRLAEQSRLVLEDNPKAALDELLKAGGSPHGARPKALVGIPAGGNSLIHGVDDIPDHHEHWIVKFRAASDPIDAGAVENAFADMASEAGVDMPPTRLFPANRGPGYFGIKRSDRDGNRRVHMQTISGLFNLDHKLPSLGYSGLLKATRTLTRRQADVDRIFARTVFNVLAHSRDDHTKNHSSLMSEDGQWSASPAYDLTFASGPGGEHALDIGGEGRDPGMDHIRAVARDAGVSERTAASVIDRVKAAVDRWPAFASSNGVSKITAAAIDRRLNGVRTRPRKPRGSARP